MPSTIKRPDTTPDPWYPVPVAQGVTGSAPRDVMEARMATILVIEDDPDILASVVEMLEQEGYDAIGAENGRVGVAIAVAERPDLVLCDVTMPELDGHGVLTSLRQFHETVDIPFVFLSARGERQDVRAGMNLGADDYLIKPFTPQELLDAVRARLRARPRSAPPTTPGSERTLPSDRGRGSGLLALTPADVVDGRFEVVGRAGAGGMATVFRAHDRREDRVVALKVLHDPGDRGRDRFLREARLLAELRHPHVVRYVAHGVTPTGDAYLALEWLEGEDLSRRFARAPLTIHESMRLALHAADALGYAHARGVLHRDVKPSNLFLVDNDVERVKLLDFGIARVVAAVSRATRTGTALGTPGYMAPEQAVGAKEADARVDVFSLGCVLFECLTGQAPFTGENVMVVLSKVLFEEAPAVTALRPEVPPELAALLHRMLARRPEDRPRDGNAVVAEIQRLDEALLREA